MKVNIRSHCSKGLLAHTPGIPVSLADYFLLKLLTLLQLLDPCFIFVFLQVSDVSWLNLIEKGAFQFYFIICF